MHYVRAWQIFLLSFSNIALYETYIETPQPDDGQLTFTTYKSKLSTDRFTNA
tara:strand:+ start:671 stop:826 length:156 start_codon:yes stop_codon:yes gene_type:complete